jgi:hypothetical protein
VWGVLACALLGCPAPGARDAVIAVGPAGPPQLVCADDHGALVVADAQGRQRGPLRIQPPLALSALASAGPTLVGAGQGRVLVYVQRDGQWRWHQAARWEPAQWASEPLRAASYGESAVVWMRGRAPGSVAAALEVTAQGQVIEEAVAVAERSLGGVWQSSHAPAGPYDPGFPDALRLLVAQVRVGGQLGAREEVLHSERSPWGGRLAAPDFGNPPEDGWPSSSLYYVGAAPGAPPVPLEYAGEPLGFRGLIGYGDSSQLYLDGQKAKRGDGLLVVNPPGSPAEGDSGKRKGPLRARLVPGLHPPCAVIGAGWHE